ncbi:unnamed protein product [Brugia timori]|uniref:Uncharacterized protein n=1 Tax=Brugia timori TaxID=42155 RepID=A0A3P7WCC1_9BILA|nr:unnamed protein product [Brugia timori]
MHVYIPHCSLPVSMVYYCLVKLDLIFLEVRLFVFVCSFQF